jgi:hypothetical protein
MSLARFEPTIPASERPQTDAIDRVATGPDRILIYQIQNKVNISLSRQGGRKGSAGIGELILNIGTG